MRRREFIALVGGAVASPVGLHAQRSVTPVVGFLHSGVMAQSPYTFKGFAKGLAEVGLVEGRDVSVEYRFAEGLYDRLPGMVLELMNRQVAVFAATGGVQTALAVKSNGGAIPVVFGNGSDPVRFGLVQSLNRPGGNITGVSYLTATLEAKRLGLLAKLVPDARVFGVLVNPTNENVESQLKDVSQGGVTLGRPIIIMKASTEQEIEDAFESFVQQGANALLVASDPYFFGRRKTIVGLATRNGLPAISEWSEFAQAGGLASYGTNLLDNYRLVGLYVGRILKGDKPADLPVVQATKFEFVVNLKAAESLGVTLPPGPVSAADEVIE
jgi:putative ABC transport system substrate-binding protein